MLQIKGLKNDEKTKHTVVYAHQHINNQVDTRIFEWVKVYAKLARHFTRNSMGCDS